MERFFSRLRKDNVVVGGGAAAGWNRHSPAPCRGPQLATFSVYVPPQRRVVTADFSPSFFFNALVLHKQGRSRLFLSLVARRRFSCSHLPGSGSSFLPVFCLAPKLNPCYPAGLTGLCLCLSLSLSLSFSLSRARCRWTCPGEDAQERYQVPRCVG